jgi:hypothetical protein
MASELSLGFNLSLSKSGAVLNRSYSASVDVAGRPVQAQSGVLVTMAGLDLDAGTVTSIGHVSVKHLSDGSTADYLLVGESGGSFTHKLKSGEWVEGRWNLSAVNVKTTSGQAYVEYAIVSE